MAKVALVQRIPAVLGGVEQWRVEHAAGIVDQDRHFAELVDRALQRRIDLLAVADVGHDAQRANGFGGRRTGVRVALPDGHRRAERGEPFGDAAPDALSPAGDDGDAAGEQDVGRIDGHGDSRLADLRAAHRGRAADHALSLQFGNLVVRQAQFGQQLMVVLSE